LPVADGSKEFLPMNTSKLSCSSWISFSPSEIELGPYSKHKVNYSIKVPKDAQGGYYAAIFFESIFGRIETTKDQLKAGMNIAIRIATLFYIDVEGTVKRTADLSNLVIEKDSSKDAINISLDLENTSNADITCGGTFHIMDSNSIVKDRGEFNTVYTFPGGKAKLKAGSKVDLDDGLYDVILTFDLGKGFEEEGEATGPVLTKETKIEVKNKRIVSVN
jgi:hypothetical protein